MQIKGNIWVDGFNSFGVWFNEVFRPQHPQLFPSKIDTDNYEYVFDNLRELTGKDSINLNEFVGLFCSFYQETGGSFDVCQVEIGDRAYIEGTAGGTKLAYAWKERGRGLTGMTWANNFNIFFEYFTGKKGVFDALSEEQVDAFFSKKENCIKTVQAWINDPRLGATAYAKMRDEGAFWQYGKKVNGADAYASTFDLRCKTLLRALQNAKLRNSSVLWLKKYVPYMVAATALGVGGYLVWQNYKE